MFIEQCPLRKHLQEITEKDVSEHERLLEALRLKIPHSIEVVLFEEREGMQVSDFMCYEFAFDLYNFREYKNILERLPWRINPIGADKKFVIFFLRNNSLEEIQIKRDGDFIIYFEKNQPTHAGKLTKNRIRSKWGKGLILEHEIDEVPELYGNEVKYYKSISSEDLIDLFISYAEEEHGIEFQELSDQ